jgi:hypothetical protein
MSAGRLRLKCDGTRAETRFRLSTKRTSPFKSAGASVQSTTGRRAVHISLQGLYCSCKPVFCSHVTLTGYPLHSLVSPSLLLSCDTVCHHISNAVYQWPRGLWRRFAAARLPELWARIPLRAWMFAVSVVWRQVDFSAANWSLVQRSPTDCSVWSRNLKNGAMARVGPQNQRRKIHTYPIAKRISISNVSRCYRLIYWK